MNDAFGHPQAVVVFGGTSDIAMAILDTIVGRRCRSVVLAGRDDTALEVKASRLRRSIPRVEIVDFDAQAPDRAGLTVSRAFDAAGEEVDIVIMAVGELGVQQVDETDPERVARMQMVNLTWPAAALTEIATRLRAQGHGRIVVMSSVAGQRIRRSNFIYGSAKAGLDAFALGLAEAVRDSAVSVHIVRPGFVRTKMTAGRPSAPFTVGPRRVADDVTAGLARNRTVIWSPSVLRWVFGLLARLPPGVWRRLPG